MGKYGPGVSMASVIEMETEMVEEILEKNHLDEDDTEKVMDAFREMAYQWCQSNAGACAIEAAALKLLGKEKASELFKEVLHSGVRERKFSETYPFD